MFTIKGKALAAILPHVSTDKARPTLNGFNVIPGGAVVATGGRTLAVYRKAHDATDEMILSVTPEFRKLVNKAAKKSADLEFTALGDGRQYIAQYMGDKVILDVVDGTFPSTAQVCPRPDLEAVPVATFGLDCELAARFGSVCTFWHTGDSARAILVATDDPDFGGLLMPHGAEHTMPLWMRNACTAAVPTL